MFYPRRLSLMLSLTITILRQYIGIVYESEMKAFYIENNVLTLAGTGGRVDITPPAVFPAVLWNFDHIWYKFHKSHLKNQTRFFFR